MPLQNNDKPPFNPIHQIFDSLNDREITLEFVVDSEKYFAFQRVSNDFNTLHTDSAFATERGFKDKVMYGNILNAFISYFVGMALPTRNVIIQCQDTLF